MFMRKLLFVFGFCLLASASCQAITVAEECQKRSMTAYDMGTSDSEKQRLGAEAASACFKEMEDSLKKNGSNSSSSDSKGPLPIILLLAVAGFIGYKFLSKDEKPMSPSEVQSYLDQFRSIYKPDPSDLSLVRRFKANDLASIEKLYAEALAGTTKIPESVAKGGIVKAHEYIADMRAKERDAIDATQSALDSTIKARDSTKLLYSEDFLDGSEEPGFVDSMKALVAQHEQNIEELRSKLSELRS